MPQRLRNRRQRFTRYYQHHAVGGDVSVNNSSRHLLLQIHCHRMIGNYLG